MTWHVSTSKLAFVFGAVWLIPLTTLALWAEPSCDPSDDPTACNVAAPLNVSSTDQTKSGGLTIGGALTVSGSSNLGTLVVGGTGSTFNSQAIFNNAVTISGAGSSFNYSGSAGNFIITADAIDDSEVSNTLTASIFQGPGSTSDLVDLTSEVNTTGETWVNTTGDTMTGTLTLAPTSSVDALSITPYSNQEAIYITGATDQPLVSLNPTGSSGVGLYVNMVTGASNGVQVTSSSSHTGYGISATSATSGYPILVSSTGTSAHGVDVRVAATGGYGVYAVASSSADGSGVFGSGVTNGIYGFSSAGRSIYGNSKSGYAGYFTSGTSSGSSVHVDLTGSATTTTSKALEVVGKNGYGGYFTADGDTSTALYAENTNTVAGFTKYGIQTTAATPAGIGIAATSDYGVAGEFNSASGGTALSINVGDFGTAIDANGGIIEDVPSYLGGQFYQNESASSTLFANQKILSIGSQTLTDGVSDMFFDGDSLWIGYDASATAYADISQRSLRDGHQVDSYSTTYGDSLEGEVVGDTVYFFTDTAAYFTKNRYDGSESSGSLTSSITINSSTFDGEDIWFGTTSRIYQWDGLATLTSRASGLGNIADMVYADGYLWAADSSNDRVYKMNVSSYAYSSITVGDNPQAMVYDGQHIWVANLTDDSLTRINVSDSSTETYSVSSAGTGPQTLTFDGIHVWIGYGNNDGVAAFNVAEESIMKSDELLGTTIEKLVFDGTYLWAATDSLNLIQLSAGTGLGQNTEPIVDGILMYNTAGTVVCLSVSGTTVSASTILTSCQ